MDVCWAQVSYINVVQYVLTIYIVRTYTEAIECVFCDHCADPSSQDKETCSQGADLCTVVTSLNDDGSQTVHRGCLHRVSEIDYCHEGIVHNRNGDKIIEQLYRCCDEYDLCNRNLTALRFNSTSSSEYCIS